MDRIERVRPIQELQEVEINCIKKVTGSFEKLR